MNAQQLRNSILQEAIEGRLVPQDPNDEPASVLLERIREEKRRLVKEGKLKKKDLVETPISEDEKPFEIPEGWEWVRLSTLSSAIHYGYTASAAPAGNSKLLRITDIQNDKVYWDTVPFCTIKDNELEKYQLKNRDILIARTGGTIGKTYIVRNLNEISVFASYLIRVIPLQEVNEEFLKLFMLTPCYWTQLIEASSGTGQPNVNGQSLSKLILPIPPLEEQKRILSKIEELLPMVEEYGKAQEALDKLNAELPEKLKKSILQEAIEGRLVPQDPNDEPASFLLDTIRKEKAQLVKEGKLKKKDLESTPITDEEKAFDIPECWEWVRIPDIGISQLGKTKNPHQLSGRNLPYLCSINVYWEGINLTQIKEMLFDDSEIDKYSIKKGDLLICEGGDCGRSAIWDKEQTFLYQNALHRVRFFGNINSKYILYCLYLYKKSSQLDDYIKGETIKHLVKGELDSILFPLPPLAEQHRIVAKIEELFAGIEQLKK